MTSKPHQELVKAVVEGLAHGRPSYNAGLDALGSLVEQLEAAESLNAEFVSAVMALFESIGISPEDFGEAKDRLIELIARGLNPATDVQRPGSSVSGESYADSLPAKERP